MEAFDAIKPFVVIYYDDDGEWSCKKFDSYDDACHYADSIARSREPMVYERSTYRRK